jgi:hypothetical protein
VACRHIPDHYFPQKCEKCGHDAEDHGDIKTLEGKGGSQEVCPGDWIMTGVSGENYPCKPAIFALTYDRVEETEHPLHRQLDMADAAKIARYSYGRDPYEPHKAMETGTRMGNHVVNCNYCGKEQIVVHCGTNGDHRFEIAGLRRQTIDDCVKAVESLPTRIEPISGQNFTYVQRGEAIDAMQNLEI